MRGGRGGRGGRFGGRGTNSMAHDLIRDNLEDLGMESNGYQQPTDADRSPPPLYPRISLPAPMHTSTEDMQALYRMREFMTRVKRSPYFMSRSIEQKDIARYSDAQKRPKQNSNGLAAISSIMTKDGINYSDLYFPQELLTTTRGAKSTAAKEQQSSKPTDIDYSVLLELEKVEFSKSSTAGGGEPGAKEGDKGSDNEDEELGDDAAAAADEFEMDDDYNIDHYAESDNDDGGDDGEAFF